MHDDLVTTEIILTNTIYYYQLYLQQKNIFSKLAFVTN